MLKVVLLIGLVLAVWWLLRPRRGATRDDSRGQDTGVQPMIACAQCGLHVPRHEALPGRGGGFCCEAHRTEFEARHTR